MARDTKETRLVCVSKQEHAHTGTAQTSDWALIIHFVSSCLFKISQIISLVIQQLGMMQILIFVTFSTIVRLSCDETVVSTVEGTGGPGEIHHLTPSHWKHSQIPKMEFTPGQWWETASSQWQCLRPHSHQGRPTCIWNLPQRLCCRARNSQCHTWKDTRKHWRIHSKHFI